jgi:hypothetical protein
MDVDFRTVEGCDPSGVIEKAGAFLYPGFFTPWFRVLVTFT